MYTIVWFFHLLLWILISSPATLKSADSEESGWTSQRMRVNSKKSHLTWKVFCIWTAVQVMAAWVQVTVHSQQPMAVIRHWERKVVRLLSRSSSITGPAEDVFMHSRSCEYSVVHDRRVLSVVFEQTDVLQFKRSWSQRIKYASLSRRRAASTLTRSRLHGT